MKKRITLLARVKDGEGGYALVGVPTEKNGRPYRPKADELVTTYYLRYTEGGRRKVVPVGEDVEEAYTRFLNEETRLEAAKRGVSVVLPNDRPDRVTVADAAQDFIATKTAEHATRTGKVSDSTLAGYTRALQTFSDLFGKRFMDEISAADVREFVAWMQNGGIKQRAHGHVDGTVRIRLQFLSTFFAVNGLKFPLSKHDWPAEPQSVVIAFTPEEVPALLSEATPDEADLIHFLLCIGFRDNEVAHAEYSDIKSDGTINTGNKIVRCMVKGQEKLYDFKTKNRKARPTNIRVPQYLLERLRDRRERNPEGSLIFPNSKGTPDTTLLARVRNAAKRAGFKKHFTLHTFRKTFGTLYALSHGVVNAQHLLGHHSLAVTQKYLATTDIPQSAADALFAFASKK